MSPSPCGTSTEKVSNKVVVSSKNEKESEKKQNDTQEIILNLEATRNVLPH